MKYALGLEWTAPKNENRVYKLDSYDGNMYVFKIGKDGVWKGNLKTLEGHIADGYLIPVPKYTHLPEELFTL
jgi:hypothetical protein